MKNIFKGINLMSNMDIAVSHLLAASGIFANFCGLLVCFLVNTPIEGCIATGVSLLFIIAYSIFCFKLKKYDFYNLSISFVSCNVLFPYIFFTTGGLQKAFIFYFFIAAIAYGISMRKTWHSMFPICTFFEYNFIIYIDYMHQEIGSNFLGGVDLKTLMMAFSVMFIFIFSFMLFFTTVARKWQSNLSKQVFYDELTGLYNRRKFNEDIKLEAFRFGIMIDIDDFHSVNNTYGHQYGDLVLQKLAEICLSFACDEFKVYRYGGEEFFILSRLDCERTIKNIKDISTIFKNDLNLTISAGVSSKLDYEPYQKIIKKADENMYSVKKNGKNAVSLNGVIV